MRRFKLVVVGVAIVLGVMAPSLAWAAGTEDSVHSFNLIKTTAVSPTGGVMASPGDRITVSGPGTFDLIARSIHTGGTFTHYAANGTVICRGAWKATSFTRISRSSAWRAERYASAARPWVAT